MMDCMQSFTIRINQNFVVDTTSGNIRTWGTVGQYFWSMSTGVNGGSTYNLSGFKNTNIFGVSMNGAVKSNSGLATGNALVTDWSIIIGINGNAPLISGAKTVSPDGFNLITSGSGLNFFNLSKDTNSVMFQDPYTSVKSISFDALFAQGMGAETFETVALNYNLNFTFYYQYEGE